MTKPQPVQCGVIATIFAGLAATAELVWVKVLKDLELPYFRVMGFSALLSSLAFALVAKISGAQFPTASEAKWAMLRAVFGVLTNLTMIVAIQTGAAPGDVAALTSINIVGAALLGHLFLKERLRLVHIAALLLSVSGAVLIAKPEIIFGADGNRGSSLAGNLLALASGFCISCVFICARKSAEVSMAHMACYTAGVASALCFVLPFAPFIDEVSLSTALASPWMMLGLVGGTLAILVLGITLDTMGSVMCPAAVSATVRTASSMVSGYVAQTVLFEMVPTVLTVIGAALMLAAVVIMASVRVSQDSQEQSHAQSEPECVEQVNDASSTCSTDTAQESLASFAASEFAEWEPHVTTRLRRPAGTNAKPTASTTPVVDAVGIGMTIA